MITLREMDIADYDAVITLWRQTEGMLLRETDSRQAIGRYLARNPGLSFVAEARGSLIGAVLVGTDGRRGYLQHLAVARPWRQQGIGRRLLQAATGALYAVGIDKTHLFVACDNQAAQRFYGILGWQARSEVTLYSFNAGPNSNA